MAGKAEERIMKCDNTYTGHRGQSVATVTGVDNALTLN